MNCKDCGRPTRRANGRCDRCSIGDHYLEPLKVSITRRGIKVTRAGQAYHWSARTGSWGATDLAEECDRAKKIWNQRYNTKEACHE